ncbi:TetR/AcrR family transcriptional regulator [Streptomyces sp. XM4011]|uniref:TetR/AcrR family transcriptional regulator n=1 Tax=Streptomyces sp. XM4011 TaxID=2929780 RepID=UPI001FFADD21|nr:TetR/AcrR family transcriptional regulator [Streptomyces sp. XM4011]MCK1815604.1 TetR/AcrR family transcriptional regulator [Streptomyces sp. XM4011]
MSEQTPTMTRRERLRAETTREITAIALAQLAEDGPGAISLRGIAREMGMTPRAIYSYFATRDELITALTGGIATDLADTVEAARDAVPTADTGGRLLAWALATRAWALANPQGFRLFFGDPVPGYQPPEDGPVERASRRICGGLTRLVADAWPLAGRHQPADVSWSDFPPAFFARLQDEDGAEIPPAAAALALRVWGRMHGLVALEIHGHIGAVVHDPAALYRTDMLDLIGSLGLTPPD